MRIVEFPYTLYKGMAVPIIPVQIQHKDEWFEVWHLSIRERRIPYSLHGMPEEWVWT